MWGWMGMGGEVEVGVVLVGVCPGRIASSTFLLLLRLLILPFQSCFEFSNILYNSWFKVFHSFGG